MAAWSIRGLVLLAGPIWLFGWIAAFVAPMNCSAPLELDSFMRRF
jgi:hypothetical protein